MTLSSNKKESQIAPLKSKVRLIGRIRTVAVTSVAFLCAALSVRAWAESPLTNGEHRVTVNGVKLWYKVAGTPLPGIAPVLFLHGGPGYNSYSFEKTIGAQLEPEMQMIYLDQRGSGRSDSAPDRDYSIKALAEDVEALRQALGLPQLIVMGHSFGGIVALEYAARYPQSVQKIIIADAPADLPAETSLVTDELSNRYPDVWTSVLNSDLGKRLTQARAHGDECEIAQAEFAAELAARQKVHGFVLWQMFHNPKFAQSQAELDQQSGLQELQQKRMTDWMEAYFQPDSRFPCYRFTEYARLTMPALVMVGKYDYAIGADQVKSLAAHLPHARFDEFMHSGHFIYAEEPGKFVHDVKRFIQNHSTT